MGINLHSAYTRLVVLLIVGIVIRIVLNQIVYSADATSFVIWAKYLTEHSLSDLYRNLPGVYLPYPPLYYYMLVPLGYLMKWFHLFSNEWVAHLFVKLPVIAADVAVTLLIYRFTETHFSGQGALSAASFYFLHPAVIYNTSVWGQIDSVIIALGLASIVLFLHDKPLAGFALFIIGGLIKLQTLALVPLVGILLLIHREVLHVVRKGVVIALLAIIPFLPLVVDQGFLWTIKYFASLPHQYPYTSVYAYNVWAPLGFIVSDKMLLFGLVEIRTVAMVLFWSVAGVIVLPFFKLTRFSPRRVMFAAFLLFFAFAFFSTRIHSRYFIYTLGFLAPFSSRIRLFGFLFSIFVIVNLLLPNKDLVFAPAVTFLNQPYIITIMVGIGFSLFLVAFRKYQLFLPR